jgi:hypothetical protein
VGDASGNLVSRIVPRTNKVIASLTTEGYPGDRQASIMDCACRYAVGYGSVWAIGNNTTLLRIAPHTNRAVASHTFAADLGSIGLSEGACGWPPTVAIRPIPSIASIPRPCSDPAPARVGERCPACLL